MLISGTESLSTDQNHLIDEKNLSYSKNNVQRIMQNGQIQIYQSSYRGSYSNIIRDCL